MSELYNIFNAPIPHFNLNESQDLQRTEQWFEDRKGRFTGSGIKTLMSTTRATARLEWGRPEKVLDFSETALKYIYSKAMERKRDKVIETISSIAMQYGTNQEGTIKKIFKQQYPEYQLTEVGFIEFIKDIAGASPDGYITTDKGKMGLEIKAATTWENVFLRMEVPFDEKHQDFWQIQAEMLALEVDKLMYIVAEPAQNIMRPVITDIQIKIVHASSVHQQAIINRCFVANSIVENFLQTNNFRDSVQMAVSQSKFDNDNNIIQ